jgi:hypothetical protein
MTIYIFKIKLYIWLKKETSIPMFICFIQHTFGTPSHSDKGREKNERYQKYPSSSLYLR